MCLPGSRVLGADDDDEQLLHLFEVELDHIVGSTGVSYNLVLYSIRFSKLVVLKSYVNNPFI